MRKSQTINKKSHNRPTCVEENKYLPVKCCGLKPGDDLPARILLTLMGRPRIALNADEILNTWPPPSPKLPSINVKLDDSSILSKSSKKYEAWNARSNVDIFLNFFNVIFFRTNLQNYNRHWSFVFLLLLLINYRWLNLNFVSTPSRSRRKLRLEPPIRHLQDVTWIELLLELF